MTNITLSIPDELHEKMKIHSEIRWSEVARKSIAAKIEMLEVLNKLAQKSKLTAKDVDDFSKKIKQEIVADASKK